MCKKNKRTNEDEAIMWIYISFDADVQLLKSLRETNLRHQIEEEVEACVRKQADDGCVINKSAININ